MQPVLHASWKEKGYKYGLTSMSTSNIREHKIEKTEALCRWENSTKPDGGSDDVGGRRCQEFLKLLKRSRDMQFRTDPCDASNIVTTREDLPC